MENTFKVGDVVFLMSDWEKELPMTVSNIKYTEDDSDDMIECTYVSTEDYKPRLSTHFLSFVCLVKTDDKAIAKYLKHHLY